MELSIYESVSPKNYLQTYKDTTIVDIDLFLEPALHETRNSLDHLGIDYDLSYKDTQRVFLNFFIKDVVEGIKANKIFKNYVFLLNDFGFEDENTNKVLKRLVKKALDALKLIWIEFDYSLNELITRLNNNDDCCIELDRVRCKIRSFNFNTFKAFLVRNKLTYLSNVYFSNPSNKLVLF